MARRTPPKPYEVPLDDAFAREILAIPMDAPSGPPPSSIGERVQAAVTAVAAANEYLQNSQLARIVADSLMKRLKKRGTASVRVRNDGCVVLHVIHETAAPKRVPVVQRPSRKSDLPLLEELRQEAETLGIDLSDLGRQRRAIFNRIQVFKEQRTWLPEP